MTKQQAIEARLIERLNPVHLRVANDSGMHAVPPGSESHFNAVIVSEVFKGLPLAARHRLVYETLGSLMRDIHAFSMKTLTVAEWESSAGELTHQVPPCMGKHHRAPG